MDFPAIDPITDESDGLTVMPISGGCTLYIPYSHTVDIDTLHDKLNAFDRWQRKGDIFEAIDIFLEDTQESFITDTYEIADVVYEWLENNPQKEK